MNDLRLELAPTEFAARYARRQLTDVAPLDRKRCGTIIDAELVLNELVGPMIVETLVDIWDWQATGYGKRVWTEQMW